MSEGFRLLNTYYDKIYVVTIEAAKERRATFTKAFAGLDYTFFYGADKKDFTLPELEARGIFSEKLAKQHHRFDKGMRPGEVACSLSHRMIYEDMIKNAYKRVLIFEDDASPDPKMLGNIAEI